MSHSSKRRGLFGFKTNGENAPKDIVESLFGSEPELVGDYTESSDTSDTTSSDGIRASSGGRSVVGKLVKMFMGTPSKSRSR